MAPALTRFSGPVYTCDHANKFDLIAKQAEKLQNLVGPVYTHGVDHKNHFNQVITSAQKIKQLTGPVYDVAHGSHFQEIVKGVEGMKKLVGPVYNVEVKHAFQVRALKFIKQLRCTILSW